MSAVTNPPESGLPAPNAAQADRGKGTWGVAFPEVRCIYTLALAASPQRASAAVETFLTIDSVSGGSDGGSSSGSHSAPEPSIWGFIVSLFV